jgi:predicted nucleic acid-binding protein
MIIVLDTGVLLRLVDRSSSLHQTVRTAVRLLRARGDTFTMAPQNVAEFWNVCTRPISARGGLGLSLAETNQRLRLLERIVAILPDSPNALAIWRNLVLSPGVMGVQVHDARLVSLMKVHGVNHILTLNSADFARYPGITALDPLALISSKP